MRWKTFNYLIIIFAGFMTFSGCKTADSVRPNPASPSATPTIFARETAVPPPVISQATQPPTAEPAAAASPSALPVVPTATPHPMAPYTIEGLRQRKFPGGTIQIVALLAEGPEFSRYAFSYPSDGLTITGILQVPNGAGPFPVIILNHGYYDRSNYFSGAGTCQQA